MARVDGSGPGRLPACRSLFPQRECLSDWAGHLSEPPPVTAGRSVPPRERATVAPTPSLAGAPRPPRHLLPTIRTPDGPARREGPSARNSRIRGPRPLILDPYRISY